MATNDRDGRWTALGPPATFEQLDKEKRVRVGMMLRIRWGDGREEQILVGDVNVLGGVCDCCFHFRNCHVIALRQVWDPDPDADARPEGTKAPLA